MGYSKTKTYTSWNAMMGRCYRPSCNGYERYGAIGITVCKRWHDYHNFLADMGERPEGHTLDRIDSKRGYTPSNCKWSTPSEQMRNTKATVFVEYEGKQWCLKDLREHLGIGINTLKRRLAANTPLLERKPHPKRGCRGVK